MVAYYRAETSEFASANAKIRIHRRTGRMLAQLPHCRMAKGVMAAGTGLRS
jgi:hypothetical protein